ncbi:MAG: hypothetical protein H0X29_11480 [Parachlamydiaceae bacterium]|nr:hypothetical protein [Parachlamydiaceae bacterium]
MLAKHGLLNNFSGATFTSEEIQEFSSNKRINHFENNVNTAIDQHEMVKNILTIKHKIEEVATKRVKVNVEHVVTPNNPTHTSEVKSEKPKITQQEITPSKYKHWGIVGLI